MSALEASFQPSARLHNPSPKKLGNSAQAVPTPSQGIQKEFMLARMLLLRPANGLQRLVLLLAYRALQLRRDVCVFVLCTEIPRTRAGRGVEAALVEGVLAEEVDRWQIQRRATACAAAGVEDAWLAG